MVSLNRVKRARVIAGMNCLSAVFIGDDNLIILRPRVPGLADFQPAFIALNANVPFKLSVDGAMKMRLKPVIRQGRFGFGIGTGRGKPRFAAQCIGFADEITRCGERINANIENAATGAVDIIKAMLRREGEGKAETGRKAGHLANRAVINQLLGKMHTRMHEIHQRLDQQQIAPRSFAIKVQHLALIKAERLFAQNRFAGGQALMRPRNMAVMRRGNVNRINVVARQQRVIVAQCLAAMFGAKGFSFAKVAARGGSQNAAMALFQISGELGSNIACGENAPANFIGHGNSC